MARIAMFIVLMVLLSNAIAMPGERIRRGFDNSGYTSRGGFDRGSDERDASVSEESGGGGCVGDFGRGFSNNREVAYNKDGRSSKESRRGGRSFSKASASASASALNENKS